MKPVQEDVQSQLVCGSVSQHGLSHTLALFSLPFPFFPRARMQEVIAAPAEAGKGPASALCKS